MDIVVIKEQEINNVIERDLSLRFVGAHSEFVALADALQKVQMNTGVDTIEYVFLKRIRGWLERQL